MEQASPLLDLIEALEFGSRYHISIEFFNKNLKKLLRLPFSHTIHCTPFCDEIKDRKGISRCLECKGKAMDKARRTGKAYGGLCVNGVYEYCHPVFHSGNLICIIFVGNILSDVTAFLEKSGLEADSPLLDTMERNMGEADCKRISAVVESYIVMLLQQLPEGSSGRRINATIAAVQAYIDCYFYLDFSLADIARMYHYNEKYLGTLFKKQVGQSFHDYLNSRRLSRAKTLLNHSGDSILTISTRVGFNNVTYFNRLFRQAYGMTPSQYRAGIK